MSDLTTQALNVIENILKDNDVPANIKLNAAFKVLDRVGQSVDPLDTNPASIEFGRSLKWFGP